MPNTFDEASTATQEMFSEQMSLDDAVATEEPTGTVEAPPEANPPVDETQAQQPENQQTSTMEEAVQTAETAAKVAAEKDAQLQQALAEKDALAQQNLQLQGTIDEISKKNTEKVLEDTLLPPELDIDGLAFADEETRKAAMAKYANDMSAYNRQQMMKELSPAIDFAKKGMYEAEKTETVNVLSHSPEMSDIKEMMPQLDRIIANNQWLQSDDMSMEERYINAYVIAKGVNSINNPPAQPEPPKEPTAEELLAIYNKNPAFQELIEKQRLEQIKQSQQVPPFSASSGAVNAALDIKEKPKTLEEASRRTREMFAGR